LLVSVAEHMTHSVAVGPPGTPVGSAEFVVTTDEQGTPYRISRGTRIWVAVVVPRQIPMEQVAAAPQIVRMMVGGAPGLVVVDDSRVIGVVPARTILSEVGRLGTTRSDDSGGDSALHGAARPITDAVRVRCLEPGCGLINVCDYFLPGMALDCAGGHPLKADEG
jgi:hypothetical protein